MKKYLAGILVFCMMFGFAMPKISKTYAVTYQTLVSADNELLDSYESAYYNFTIPVKSKVVFEFDDDSYGEYVINVFSGQSIVYTCSGRVAYDNETQSTELPKGTYTVQVLENDDFEFEYNLKIKYVSTEKVPVKSVKLNKTKLTLQKGSSKTLKATFNPSYATCENVVWTSSNSKIAKVNSKGKVTAKSLGTAKITVKADNKKAKCTVNVTSAYVEMAEGKSKSLKSLVKNIKGYKKGSWKSNKSSVVSVSKTGKIKCKKDGKATITFKLKSKKYKITVYSYDAKKLEDKAIEYLRDRLKNPDSLIVNSVDVSKDNSTVSIDYSAMNGFGGYNRETFIAWYEKGKFYAYL